MSEIPFWVNDRQKWVSGIGKSTTCGDVISSLLESENKSIPLEQLALVEHWKGVQRPLGNDVKIHKLWLAWGDEKTRVKFVLKRIGRKRRRRRQRYESKDDVIYPRSSDIEKLMQIIVSQGETIRSQLVKLHEREKQIDVIEETVHETRTKLSGKDYLLRSLTEDGRQSPGSSEVVAELEALVRLNDRLAGTESRICELSARLEEESGAFEDQVRVSREDCLRLRILNDASSEEISQNQRSISGVRDLVNERTELASRLEEECDRADFEEKELRAKLDRISNMDLGKMPTTSSSCTTATTTTDVRNISPNSSTSGYCEEEDDELDEDPFSIPDAGPKKQQLSFSKFTKSILKAVGVSLPPLKASALKEDDDNSDTGLSSLHSSTDEGTYNTLDTLV